jgi:protein-S-isoprenylcysteine O-methyltransferase Ste14
MNNPTWQNVTRWVKSTPNRTFILFPLVVLAFEASRRGGMPALQPFGVAFLLWGYLQYRLVGSDRRARGGGGPGLETPPERIVSDGAYAYLRNPMYLGHLIFMLGLTITLSSWFALTLFVFHAGWFHVRVLRDEERLELRFGEAYREYRKRVKRWIPGVL